MKSLTCENAIKSYFWIDLEWGKLNEVFEEFRVNQDIVKASIQAFINCLDRISLQNKKNN